MKVAMVRVGIDSGSGGMQGPLFQDGSFEYIPIPDGFGIDQRTYGNTVGRHGRPLVEYFPPSQQGRAANQAMHVDPEFEAFTYGDPTSPKAGLRHLQPHDFLVFYCGLEGWGFTSEPGLYLLGYFDVLVAGKAEDFGERELQYLFGANFHVRHDGIYQAQRDSLVLIKGSTASRLFTQAVLISARGQDRISRPLKVLSPAMQAIFGSFGGRVSFQRSPTRWVDAAHVACAVRFLESLP